MGTMPQELKDSAKIRLKARLQMKKKSTMKTMLGVMSRKQRQRSLKLALVTVEEAARDTVDEGILTVMIIGTAMTKTDTIQMSGIEIVMPIAEEDVTAPETNMKVKDTEIQEKERMISASETTTIIARKPIISRQISLILTWAVLLKIITNRIGNLDLGQGRGRGHHRELRLHKIGMKTISRIRITGGLRGKQ